MVPGSASEVHQPSLAPRATAAERLTAVLALDGDPSAAGHLAIADWLSRDRDATIRVLSVVDPAPARALEATGDLDALDGRIARRHVVERALGRGADRSRWPVSIMVGSVPSTLADASAADDVQLVVIGLPARIGGRAPRDDAALSIVRRSRKPVLAVARSLRVPPRVAVAAIDFTRSSLHAARAAVQLLAPGGTLYLAHVQPQLERANESLQMVYAQGIVAAFDRVVHELGALDDVDVQPIILQGSAREELNAFAERVDADLIALGTSAPDTTRLNGGRLSAAMLRAARRSLLVAPAAETRGRHFDE